MTDKPEWLEPMEQEAARAGLRLTYHDEGRPATLWRGDTFCWVMPSGDDWMRVRQGRQSWQEWAAGEIERFG